MKRVLFVLVLAGACIVGVGFYQGWFALSEETDEGKVNLNLTVDKDKLKADTDTAAKNVEDLGRRATERIRSSSAEK